MNAHTTRIPLAHRIAAIALASLLGFALLGMLPATAQASDSLQASPANAQDAAKATTVKAIAKAKKKKKAKVHKVYTAAQWRGICRYKGGTFKIMRNITLRSTSYYLTISKNKKYTIDLNGKRVATSYTGVHLRTVCPLYMKKGTVVMKTSDKAGKGVFYSTETAAVCADGKSKFYLKSGAVVNNATEFRSDITSGIYLYGNAKCYIQGKSKVRSIGNGVALLGKSRLYATGNPYVRAGYNTYKGQFTHYGCGVNIASRYARAYLKGGSYGTMASPDASLYGVSYAMSANYPILDQFGYALPKAVGSKYKVIDAKGNTVAMRGSNLEDIYGSLWTNLLAQYGYSTEKRYTTTTKSSDGYYTVYVRKA